MLAGPVFGIEKDMLGGIGIIGMEKKDIA